MRPPEKRSCGLTLVELLAVMGIIILLMAAMIPSVGAITSQARFRTGVDTAASAVVAARAVATQPHSYPRNDYHGAAALFTPSGEIRIVYAPKAPSALFETGGHSSGKSRAYYEDYPNSSSLQLPSGIRAVGIARGSKGLKLLGAPFGVRFNKYGVLFSAASSSKLRRLIYYDYALNETYPTGPVRPGSYNPDNWDPETATNQVAQVNGKYVMDFAVYETVIGVVVFDNMALREAGHDLQHATKSGWSQVNDAASEWIMENGAVLIFNRYNGKVVESSP